MGKFGKKRIPDFAKDEVVGVSAMGSNPKMHQQNLSRLKNLGLVQPGNPEVIAVLGQKDLAQIQAAGYKIRRVSANDHFIKIKTVFGEEAIVNFDASSENTDWEDGMGYGELVGEHEGIEYIIPCEISNVGGGSFEVDDIMTDDIEAAGADNYEPANTSVSINNKTRMMADREKRNDPNYFEKVIGHLISMWQDGPKKPIMISAYRERYSVTNPETQINAKTGEITADNGEMIDFDDVSDISFYNWTNREAGQSIQTVYPGSSIPFHAYGKLAEGRASNSFDQFVNECWSPMPESYVPGLSDSAKQAIKRICEEVLIHEAHHHDMTDDESQTYESYLTECHEYLMECMMQAAQKLKV